MTRDTVSCQPNDFRMHMMLVYKVVGCQPTEVLLKSQTVIVIRDTVGCQPNHFKSLQNAYDAGL